MYTIPEFAVGQAGTMWGQTGQPLSSAWPPQPQPLHQHALPSEARQAVPLTSLTGQPPDGVWSAPPLHPNLTPPQEAQMPAASTCPENAKEDSGVTPSMSSSGPATAKADVPSTSVARRRSRASKDSSSNSSSSDVDDGRPNHRKSFRNHKKRAGRSVRERNLYRLSGERAPKSRSSGTVYESGRESWFHGELFLHATRFGLFCAMAWSMNSILFSLMRLMQDGSLSPVEAEGVLTRDSASL